MNTLQLNDQSGAISESEQLADADLVRELNRLVDENGQAAIMEALKASNVSPRAANDIFDDRIKYALAATLAEITHSSNPRLAAEVAALACGLIVDASTFAAVARKHGVSRVNVRNRVKKYCEEHGLKWDGYSVCSDGAAWEKGSGSRGKLVNKHALLDEANRWVVRRAYNPDDLSPKQARAIARRFGHLFTFLSRVNARAQ